MKKKTMIAVFTLAMTMLVSRPAAAEETVVAKIGPREVKAAEIKPYLDDLTPADREAILADKAARERFVRGILVREAVLADAAAAGWDKNPEVVRGAERAKDQYVLESYLLEVSKVAPDYPAEAEVKEAYQAERANLNVPRRLELSQIFIAAGSDKNDAKKEADGLSAQLKAKPGEFGRLAREKSDETSSAARDGKIGWLVEANIAPEIRRAAAELSKGEISPPIEGREGFHILRLDGVREAGPASYEEAAPEIRQALRDRRALLNRESHLQALLQKQPVSVNELALDALSTEAEN